MMKYLLLVLVFLFSQQVIAQDNPNGDADKPKQENVDDSAKKKAKKEKKAKKKKEKKEKKAKAKKKDKSKSETDNTAKPKKADSKQSDVKTEAKNKVPKEKVPYRFMANIHGGIGLMNYFGDIRDNPKTTVHRIGNRAGYNFGIGGNVTNWLDVNVNVLMGSVTWNQNSSHANPKNFEAEVFTAGANLVYNFRNFIRDPKGITPFISAGVSYSDFDVYSDLQDSDGNVYYYWDDGTIRNVDQSNPATDDIRVLERDFEYETRLNEFPIATFSVPVGGGLDFNISRKFAFRLGAHYYFAWTDKMDNVGGNSGLTKNDGFLYTSMTLFFKFDPFKKKAKKLDVPDDDYSGLADAEISDSDGDGVSDFYDQCAATPRGLPVDKNGCPADDDRDGIPNYRDKELNTPAGRIVDSKGVAVSYQELYKTYGKDTASLKRSEVDEQWLFSQIAENNKYTVHVGTYTNYDIPTQLKIRLSKMEGLIEKKINDSVSVFVVGEYDDFESAEKKQNELIESGIDEAFGVNKKAVDKVAEELDKVKVPEDDSQQKAKLEGIEEDTDKLVYGVELREYRLRIQLDRLSKLIAQHGVEMTTTTGGLKIYTIGAFDTFAEAEALKAQVIDLGVKNPEVVAKFNNQKIDIDEARKKEKELNQGE